MIRSREKDFGSFFHFPHHRGIADFRRFISISHIVTDEMTDADKIINHNILSLIRQTSGSETGLILKSGFKSLSGDILALLEVCSFIN